MKTHFGVFKKGCIRDGMDRRDGGKRGYYPNTQDVLQYHLAHEEPGKPKFTGERTINTYPCWEDIGIGII